MKQINPEKKNKKIVMRKNKSLITKAQALVLLDEIDCLRRDLDKFSSTDYALRAVAAIVAGYAGYSNRNDWTDDLKADANTLYYMDYNDTDYIFD